MKHHLLDIYLAYSTDSLTGVSIYQGPVIIDSCFFDKFVTKSWCIDDESSTECADKELITRYSGAISFKRANNYPSMTSSYIQNNTFGFCDNVSVRWYAWGWGLFKQKAFIILTT